MYPLKAPETKRQWAIQVKEITDFLKLDCTMEEKAK
jgi:hypothetical protein